MSEETKHTPGPWVAGSDPCHYDAPEVRSEEWAIYVPKFDDAKLIAAAPEMLKALKLAELWLCNSVPVVSLGGPKPLPVIAAAIAKATQ